MSNLEQRPAETLDRAAPPQPRSGRQVLAPREVPLGGTRAMVVRRTLPHRQLRTIGAWCFLDDYGPHDVAGGPGMQVPPHPHTGLQTVTWLLDGEVRHQDSLGSDAIVRPGALNLMTAGRGISHAETSPAGATGTIRGAAALGGAAGARPRHPAAVLPPRRPAAGRRRRHDGHRAARVGRRRGVAGPRSRPSSVPRSPRRRERRVALPLDAGSSTACSRSPTASPSAASRSTGRRSSTSQPGRGEVLLQAGAGRRTAAGPAAASRSTRSC